jgi:diguanylate cyclase (GGDEF)-like protein/PAS domain S-box-containing protein
MSRQSSTLNITVLISEPKSFNILKSLIEFNFGRTVILEKFDFQSDLIIIDDRSFIKYQDQIKKLKEKDDQFIPLLFLKHQNTRLNKIIYDYVEDIVEIPTAKELLRLKINNLLNIRNYWLKKEQLEEKYYKIFDNISDLIFLFRIDKKSAKLEDFFEVNHQTLKTLAYERKEIQNLGLEKIKKEIFVEAEFEKIMEKSRENRGFKFETTLTGSKNNSILVEIKVQQIEEDDKILLVFLCRDISEEKQKEKEIKFLLFHDELTGVYNRRFLEEELERLDTSRQLPLSIMMIDVNGLKLINDSFGHHIGDSLLKKVAANLKAGVRKEDIVARFGGDEFAILLPQTSKQDAEIIADRIKQNCSQSYIKGNVISVAIGIAAKSTVSENIEEIFKLADDRMYYDKKQCKNCQ